MFVKNVLKIVWELLIAAESIVELFPQKQSLTIKSRKT
jgi:hypothetical protein